MRSVWVLSLAKSYLAIEQWRRISSHAFCGMMPRRAWTHASAASTSRYFWMRFSSAKMRRIGSVENMSRKIPELTPTAVILQPFGGSGRIGSHPYKRCGRTSICGQLEASHGGQSRPLQPMKWRADLARLCPRGQAARPVSVGKAHDVRANNPARHDAPLPTLQIG